MNEVYSSAIDALYYRGESVKAANNREDHMHSVYGSADRDQTILISGGGVRPTCSGGIIIESEEKTVNVRGEEHIARDYTLNPVGVDTLIKEMPNATRDDLRLVLTVGSPDILNNLEFQQAFRERAEETITEGVAPSLQAQRRMENEQFEEFFGQIQGAVYDPAKNTYFPQGYVCEQAPSTVDDQAQ